MYNAPYQGVANQLSQYGRFGDSQLVHMNPIEVQMLASLSPTGRLTTNPMTGQQEAFLPFLAPLLGSFLGSSLLTGAGAGALGGLIGTAGLSSAAAGAIGSGLATTLATGDLEQGIMSGITGFGLGSALGNLSKAVPGVPDAATAGTQAATDAATQAITPEALNIQPLGAGFGLESQLPTSPLATAPMEQFLPMSQQLDVLSQGLQAPLTTAAPAAPAAPLTAMDRLAQPFQQPGQLLSELAKPSTFLPMYVGETGRMARQQELMGRGSMRAFEEDQEAERQKTLGQIGDVFNRVRAAYPGVGYAQGGQVQGYFEGGDIENQIYNALMQSQFAEIPAAKDVQLALRGQYAVPDIPRASYSALDVGGEGYMPGVAPEFQYFTSIDPNAPADGDSGEDAGIGPGPFPGAPDYFDPNFDFGSLFGNFRGYQNFADLFGGGAGQPPMPGTTTDFIDPSMERDVFAGGTPGFYDRDFSSIDDFANNYDPSFLERYLNEQVTPEAIQQQMGNINPFAGGMPPQQMNEPMMPPQMDQLPMPVPPISQPPTGAMPPPMAEAPRPPMIPPMQPPSIPYFGAMPSPVDQLPPGTLEQYPDIQALLEAIQAQQPPMPPPPVDEGIGAFRGIDEEMEDQLNPFNRNRFIRDRRYGGGMMFQEGGMTPTMDGMQQPPMQDEGEQLLRLTVAAIRGEVENADQIIQAFVQQYGPEEFLRLREAVLQEIVPNAQTEGMIEGEGGGQDDLVNGMIGTQRPVAVSPGEYIIPADAVALAGGGYSGDGAKFFDGLVDDIRSKTMGTTEQIRPYRGER